MKLLPTSIPDVQLIELTIHGDNRGFFVERYNEAKFKELGIPTHYVQDNHSRSAPGVLRGLHAQHTPSQGKLVGCARGAILDVAVDIRPNSKTFGQVVMEELSDSNGRLLYIPAGFAHGFLVISNELTDVFYKVSAPYNPQGETCILWSDPDINIPWPVTNPTISGRDQQGLLLKDYLKAPPSW